MDCIFCKIIKGEIPSHAIYEDNEFFAFLDVKPINPGHVLLIPKEHREYLFDLDDLEYSKLLLKAKEIAQLLKSKLNPKKVGMAIEGFGVSHLHIHLIPLNNAGELNPQRAQEMDAEKLTQLAEQIKS